MSRKFSQEFIDLMNRKPGPDDLSEEEAMALATEAVKAARQERQAKLERLRVEIQQGINSGESKPLDMDAIIAEANARYQKHQKQESPEK